jgi:hypothetical protein
MAIHISTSPPTRHHQQEGHDHGEHDPHQDRDSPTNHDRPMPLMGGQLVCRQGDHHRIVARQHDVDHDDLGYGNQVVERHANAAGKNRGERKRAGARSQYPVARE